VLILPRLCNGLDRRVPATLINLGALCFFGFLWGLTIPLSKVSVSTGHHTFGLIFWQLAITTLILGAYLLLTQRRIPVSRKHLLYYLIIAFIGTLIPNSFSFMAIRELPAGIMSVVIATVPIMSLAVALLARIEVFQIKRLFGIVCGVSALILLALPDVTMTGPKMLPWIVVALIAPICYGIEGNFVAVKNPPDLSPVVVLFSASLLGSLIIGPVAWFGGYWVSMTTGWDAAEWAIVGSALGHMSAYAGYLWLVQRAGAVFTSQVAYVVTLTGVFASIAFLDEQYGWIMWIAVAMMLIGVTLVRPSPSNQKG